MTYFNPETYNWKELKGDHKIFMDGYNYCIEEVETAFSNLIEDAEFETETPTLTKVIQEIQESLQKEVVEWISRHRVQMTAEIMDSDETYWEK